MGIYGQGSKRKYLKEILFIIVIQILFFSGCQQREEADNSFVLDENLIMDNMDYFENLCVCVPVFDDINHLEDDFYAQLVNMSILSSLGNHSESVDIEERPYYMAKISLEEIEEYTLLLFGAEFPKYEPSFEEMQENEGNFYYEDGFYYIGWYDPLDIMYSYSGCQLTEKGNLLVEFKMSGAVDGKSFLFELEPADNENGFIIVSKKYI